MHSYTAQQASIDPIDGTVLILVLMEDALVRPQPACRIREGKS